MCTDDGFDKLGSHGGASKRRRPGGQPKELRVDALSDAEWNYLRGLFLTDGYSDRSAKWGRFRVRFLLQGNEGELGSRVCELLRRAGLSPCTYKDSKKNMLTVEVKSMQLFGFLPDKQVLTESAKARSRFFGRNRLCTVEGGVPFLAGLLDGDGYCGVLVGRRYFFRTVTVSTWTFSQDNSLFLVDYVRRFVESLAPNGVRMKRRRGRRTLAACFRKSSIAALLDAGIARYSWKVARWLRLTSEARSERSEFFTAGRAADALGVSQPKAHKLLLKLSRAGLVSYTKIPNYSYGRGVQYLYYCDGGSLFGSGVVGYLRSRIHSDLTGREVVAELLPRDVPSADMIVQHQYPLLIHVGSGRTNGLRLHSLEDRIDKVEGEFRSGRGDGNLAKVLIVTLWSSNAAQLRENFVERGCLCIPFSRRWVNMLADLVLHHVSLRAFLGEDEGENEQDNTEAGGTGEEVRSGEGCKQHNVLTISSETKGKVLAVVRELGGVEPRVVAERLGIPLPRVSEAVAELKGEGLVKVVKNLPYIASLRKSNATYYLDACKATALHDTLMNEVWKRNIELGGRSRDYAFEYGGKTWNTDGLLDNKGGKFLLEVFTSEQGANNGCKCVLEKVESYSSQIGYNGIRGVAIIVLEQSFADRVRREFADTAGRHNLVEEMTDDVRRRKGVEVGSACTFVSTLRSREEKLQFESLLLHGDTASYHRNPR